MKILLVEDDSDDAEFLRLSLLQHNDSVYITRTAGIADAVAALSNDRFDVVLLDLHLPDGSGAECVEQIQQAETLVPIVVLSARLVKLPPPGIRPCAAYLTKPCRMSQLRDTLQRLLGEMVALRKDGKGVIFVSSGAIGTGLEPLGFSRRPESIPALQAAAAVGQSILMEIYNNILSTSGYSVAQLLLTHDDFQDRRRYLNVRNLLAELEKQRVLPVINENDSVAVEEIRFGDNDILAGLVANATDASQRLQYPSRKSAKAWPEFVFAGLRVALGSNRKAPRANELQAPMRS